jgi:hypothetical protein
MRALTEHLQDPTFWKALGKARSWQDIGAWLFHWHRFIDHIAFGKDVESFFKTCKTVWGRAIVKMAIVDLPCVTGLYVLLLVVVLSRDLS